MVKAETILIVEVTVVIDGMMKSVSRYKTHIEDDVHKNKKYRKVSQYDLLLL